MPRRFALACCAVFVFSGLGRAQEGDVYGLTQVHAFDLSLSASEWERMNKVAGGPGFFAPKKPVAKEGEAPFEWHRSVGFGLDFPWAHADLVADGVPLKDVGVRYKGNGSYLASGKALKKNLKIEIDHYDAKQRWRGLKTLTLNAGGVDGSRLREALAYAVYRDAGVPAPRTAFAAVTLTVPGKFAKEFLGLYTLVEHVDKGYLRTHFADDRGLLMKPEGVRGIDYLGDDWAKYERRYLPKRPATPSEAERMIGLAKLVAKSDDATFAREIGDRLDVDGFFRYLAVTTMLPNTDTMTTTGHNYFMYLSAKSGKLAYMPWDLDLAFAGFPVMGSVAEQTTWNILKPAPSRLRLVDRLLANAEWAARYREVAIETADRAFQKDKLLARVAEMEKATGPALAREREAKDARKEKVEPFGAWIVGFFDPQPELKSFVTRRTDAVAAQVAKLRK